MYFYVKKKGREGWKKGKERKKEKEGRKTIMKIKVPLMTRYIIIPKMLKSRVGEHLLELMK